jgi:hypothetical protein
LKQFSIFILFILLTLSSCNFESGSEDSSGGGLFTGHKPVEDAFILSVPSDQTAIEAHNLDFTLTHPYKLTVTGLPRLTLDVGGTTVFASYLTGNGTNILTFRYTVTAGEDDLDGIDIDPTLDLNGGTVQYSNSGVLTAATNSISLVPSTENIFVDTTGPSVTVVTPPTAKTYYENEQLEFIVIYDDLTIVTGTPRLALTIGASPLYATYISGSGTSTHIYRYVVQSSDTDLDGITLASPIDLNSGTVKDEAGNLATLNFFPIPMTTTYVEGDSPYVTSINLPSNNTYILGQAISIGLTFNEIVNITSGVPGIDLQIGSNLEEAVYVSGTGTNTLTFNYIISQGDEDTNGIGISNTINLNSANIQDSDLNDARIAITPPLTPGVLVDGSVPTVTAFTVPTDGNHTTSQNMDFVIEFSKNVLVTNTPRINITLDTGTVYADYVTGSGSDTLVFRYSVTAPDIDNDGILIGSNSIDLNSTGTIVDATYTSLNALLDFTAFVPPDMTNIKVNETPSTQLAITAQPTNTYKDDTLSPSITVEIRDVLNNLVITATDTVTLSFGTDPSAGSATLTGTLSVGAIGGIATFNDLSIDTLNSGYTFTVTTPGLTSDTSIPFDIIEAPPTQVAFVDQPTSTFAGANLSPAITVEIRDAFNNIVTSSTDNVTIAFGTDPSAGTGTLGGTLTVAAVSGIATFTDINIDKAFSGYTFTATSGVLTVDTSNSFTISPAAKAQLGFRVEPNDTDYGVNIAPSIEVEIQDAFGNRTPDTDTITLAINNNPGGSTLSGTTSVSAATGVATFSDISLDQVADGYTLSATAAGLTLGVSSAFNIIATPTQLAVTQEPTDTYNSFDIAPSITVELRDVNNNLVVAATDNVTLAFGTDPTAGAAVIGGTLTVTAVGGIATFTNINIDLINNGYTFDFTSGVLTNATSTAFNITQAPATQVAFIQEPSNTIAGENITSAMTVEIQDANGNVVSNSTDNVILAFSTDASAAAATLGGTLTIPAVAGVATFSDISIDKAFTGYDFQASSGILTSATSAAFNITPAVKSQLAFIVEPTDVDYGVNIAPSIEAEIQDAFGNRTSDTDSITLSINNNPGGATLSGTLSVNAIAGVASFTDINLDEISTGYTLDATGTGLTLATSAAFNVIATPTQLAITTEPTDAFNGFTISPDITVEIRDSNNNLVTDATDNVTLAFGTDPSAGGATIGGTLTVAAVAGIATFSAINIDIVNSGYTFDFSSGALTGATSALFNINQAPATQLAYIQEPTSAIAGESIAPSITVEIQDANGTVVPTATDNIILAFGTDPSGTTATLSGTLTVAAIAGTASFSDINIDKAFSGFTLAASSGILTGTTSAGFNITPAVKAQLGFSIEPTDVDYGVNITPSIEVEIQDAFGNKTTDTDSITLAINNNPGGATLSGTLSANAVAGVASFSDINLDQIAAGYTLDATAAGLTLTTSASFEVIATATQLAITQEPTNTYNGFNITPAITVEIRDASNNLVIDATDSVTLSFGTDPSAGAATISGTLTVNAVGGIATFSDISIDDINNAYTFSFSSGALTAATSAAFNITQAPATQLSFTQQPSTTVAGVNITPSITIEIQDANGTLVATATDNVTIGFGTDASSGAATLSGTLTVAAIAGIVTFSDINIDKAFTSYTLTTTSGILTSATSSNFDIVPAAKAQLAFSVEPVNAEYGVNITPSIELEIQDAFGNKTADTDSITLALNNNPGASTLSGTLSVNAVAGTVSFTDINLDQVATGYTLDATGAGLTLATSASFDIIAVPTQLIITQDATDTYNGFSITPSITVEIRDASNNLVTSATDNVTLSFGTDASFGGATLGGTLTTAAVGGIATFSDINIDFVANSYTLNFTSGSLASALTTTFNITQAPATQLAFTQNPTAAVAGVNIAPSITVEVQDANGNIVPSSTDNITLAFSTDPSAGAATLGGTLTVAAASGLATFNDISLDKAFTGYTLQASSGGLTLDTSNPFNITPATKAQLGFNVEPTNANYGVNITPSIVVEIQDTFGNKTTDTDTITLSINNNPAAGSLSGTLSVPAISGSATFGDISIDNSGIGYTLDATATGLTLSTSASFDITSTPSQLVITQEPTDTYNSVNISPAITVEIRDASNNLVTSATNNVTVSFGTDPSGGAATLAGTLTVAAIGGIATFSDLDIDNIQNGYTLDFNSGVLTNAVSSSFNITQAPATQLAFIQNPTNTIAGVNINPAITVEVQDASGNIISAATDNITLSFQTDPSLGAASISGTVTIAAIAGTATFSDINIDKALTGYTLKAAAGGLTDATSNSFNISAATKSQLAFSIQPLDTAYDSNFTPSIEVEIQDAFGNKTNDTDTVTLSINTDPSTGTAIFSGTLSQAATSGTAVFAGLNIDTPGVGYDLNANATGLTFSTSDSFNIDGGAPTQLIITQQPSNTLDGINISPAITVELRDVLNNLSNVTNNVTVNFGTDPTAGSATLSGSLTVAAVAGVATFSDLNIDIQDTGYTLSFSSGALTGATSNSFDIVGPAVLGFSPSADFDFGTVSLGDSEDTTFLISHSGAPATSVGETTLVPPFTFKGGSYPGTGGTCGTTITADCTIVSTYTPTAEVTSNETVTIVYHDGNALTNTTRNLTGTGLNSTPTSLNVIGPNAVITNNCIPYSINATDDNGNIVNVSGNEGVSLVINNGSGDFYSDSGCTTTTTTATILSGTSSIPIYFKTTVANQSLTLIFNASTLNNTSRSITSSNEPVDIIANVSSEIIINECTQAEVSLVDTNGIKTGASSAQLIDITTSGNELVYNDAFCTGQITQISYAQYEGTKNIYLKNAAIESSTISFTDNATVLNADSANVSFVSALTWWDANYGKRIKVSLNNLDQANSFTDIPVLIKLDSSKLNYADLLANGDDIRFTLNDHTTTLSYSIDTWNTSGTSYIWVKVPSIVASTEMDIYMYYNYGSATNSENSSNVWNSYEGVWLMNKSGANYIDETGSGKTGTASGAGTTDVAGPIGNAVNFDGADTLTISYDLALTLGSTSTLSFWIKTAQVGDATDWRAPGITGMSGTAASQDLFYGYIKDTGVIGSSAGGGTQVESNFVINDDTWRYVTVSRDETSGEFRYYINGVFNGSGNSGTGFKNRSFYDFGATTKAWGGGGFFYLEGSMDSIRMSNSVLSDERVKAEYKFTTDTNMTYAAPETP